MGVLFGEGDTVYVAVTRARGEAVCVADVSLIEV